MLDQTAVTTPLARTTRSEPHRAGPARRAAGWSRSPSRPRRRRAGRRPPRRPPTAGASAPAAPRAPSATLVVLLLLAALAVGAFVLITQGSEKQVQLKEDIQGGVEQSVQQLEDLIRENTR